jgi:hypothetical protein
MELVFVGFSMRKVICYSKAHLVCNKQTLVFPAFAPYKKPKKRCPLLGYGPQVTMSNKNSSMRGQINGEIW